MSSWFTRGWTALELAKSRKVKVLFRSKNQGSIIKDLDEDILAEAGKDVAAKSIKKPRDTRIRDVNDILTALGPHVTSKLKDMAIIAGLLARISVPGYLPEQEIYQHILKKTTKVSQGHLFHNSATMPEGFSWCPTSLLDMALAPDNSAHLLIQENGDVVGAWRVFPLDSVDPKNYIWKDTHALVKVKLQLALENRVHHLLLVESKVEEITRALLVRKEEETLTLYCQFVGPMYFHPPLRKDAVCEEKTVRIGGIKKGQDRDGWTRDHDVLASKGPIEPLLAKLLLASEKGDKATIQQLLQEGANVNGVDSKGPTTLLLAAASGNEAMVETLLVKGADPDIPDKYTGTALHYAARKGYNQVVQQLLERAEPNAAEQENKKIGDKTLLDRLGQQALHLAAERGNEKIVNLLLETADLNYRCKDDGQTVLHRAAWGGSKAGRQVTARDA
jgi:hypothetical protein